MEEKILKQKENKIVLENRKKLSLTGIEKVESTNLNQVVLQTNNTLLVVLGSELHIDKLDVAVGHIELSGKIDCIKYADKKQSLFKRMFR